VIDIRPALLEKFDPQKVFGKRPDKKDKDKGGDKKPNPFLAALKKKKEDARDGGKKKLPFGGKKAPPFGKKK
jgi:hypothetical protein